LEQFLIAVFVIEFACLLLAQSVDRFRRIGFERRTDRPCFLSFHFNRFKSESSILEQAGAIRAVETDGSGSLGNRNAERAGGKTHRTALLHSHIKISPGLLRYDSEGFPVGELTRRNR
jgi:hypothetical protein